MGEKNWMKKVIFFTDKKDVSEALENFNLDGFKNKNVPLKLHMGEIKNKYFPRPKFVKHVVDTLKDYKIRPFLFDTTVAYKALRHTRTGYKKIARLHGFSKKKMGCNIVIDEKGKNIEIENRNYEVADSIINSSHIFALTHVKGHNATGFGGAIKNLGMGGVTKETKKRMHIGSGPIYKKDNCTYCGVCSEVCPFDAIKVKKDSWEISDRKCFGCGVCVENCNQDALEYKDADLQYVLACSAKACLMDKNVLYLNELKRISKNCDCDPFAGPIICPDIGYLLSDDPVAIDKASLDLVHEIKPDLFEKINKVDPYKQIEYGDKINLGSKNYQLIEL